jgi:hypothetical protein
LCNSLFASLHLPLARANVELGVKPAALHHLTGGIEHTVATAHVSGDGVVGDSLGGAGNRGGGDVGGTEVVHEGGVGPVDVDGRAVGEHALPASVCM